MSIQSILTEIGQRTSSPIQITSQVESPIMKKTLIIEGRLSNPRSGILVQNTYFNYVNDVRTVSQNSPNAGFWLISVNGAGVVIDGKALLPKNYDLYVTSPNCVQIINDNQISAQNQQNITIQNAIPMEPHKHYHHQYSPQQHANDSDSHLTDEQIKARIDDRFKTLEEIVTRATTGNVNGAVIFGAPGVGKSYCVEETLVSLGAEYLSLKGKSTPGGLYDILYQVKDPGQVLVIDDCDSLLYDETALDLLKAILDSNERRVVSWASRRDTEIPQRFQFFGSVIFITNTDFELEARKNTKISKDIEAILDRCLYLDLTIRTVREKMIRIRQVAFDYNMLIRKGLSVQEGIEVMEYIEQYKNDFRQLSIRRLSIIAGLRKTGGDWRRIANQTALGNSRYR